MRMLGHKILYALLCLLARWNYPGIAARVLLLTTQRWSVTRSNGSWRFRALVLSRTGFQEDVEQSFRDAEDFEIVAWPGLALKALASELLSPSLDHNNYITDDPKIEATKATYRQYLKAIWRAYIKVKPIDVVLTGNFAYFTEREFATVLEEVGTPFIALHKENVRPPRRVKDYWFTLYKERRGKFTGRKILVYNEIERQLEIASGVADHERIVVAGMPRLDRLHRWRRANAGKGISANRPHVLFFGFSRYDKLTAIQRKAAAGIPGNMEDMEGWNELSWGRFCTETHRTLVDLARERPDLDVTIKSKGQKRKRGDILQTLDEIEKPIPENLAVVVGGDPYALIIRSRVVVGFNTTGLLEAIAAGKPVIVPSFGEACDEAMQDLIVDLGEAVEYARSADELKTMIANYADDPRGIPAELPQEAMRVLRYWTGNDDGSAGLRAVEAVRAEIFGSTGAPGRLAMPHA